MLVEFFVQMPIYKNRLVEIKKRI